MRAYLLPTGLLTVLLAVLLTGAGCPETQSLDDAGAARDSATVPDLACYPHPRTHVEIINACTTAQAIDKQPVLPLLRPDGKLPPLP
jgi:hypothetical protein